MRTIRKKDLVTGLAGVLLGAVLAAEGAELTYPSRTFPLAVSGAILFFSALLMLKSLFCPAAAGKTGVGFLPSGRTLAVIVTAVLYVGLIDVIGFYSASFLCIMFISALTSGEKVRPASLGLTAVSALIFLSVIWGLFSRLLHSTIPRGIWF